MEDIVIEGQRQIAYSSSVTIATCVCIRNWLAGIVQNGMCDEGA